MRFFTLLRRWGYLIVILIALLCIGYYYPRSPLPPRFGDLFPEGYYTVQSEEVTNGIPITVQAGPQWCLKRGQTTLDCYMEFLADVLPSVLSQFGVPEDQIRAKAERALPVLGNFIATELGGDDFPPLSLLKRGLWDDLKDIGCGIVAALTIPVYLYNAAVFRGGNHDPVSITDDQNFFIFPVHGDIASSGPVQVFYQDIRPFGFGHAIGTTFNRDVYTVFQNAPEGNFSPTFKDLIRKILLHELTHVLQYRSMGYSLFDFGIDYLFQACRYGYNDMPLENEARGNEARMDGLLFLPGLQFYQAWSSLGLKPTLGFPVQQTYTTLTGDPRGTILELHFQYGFMQLISGTSFRTFNSDGASLRQQAQCTHLRPCRPRRGPEPPGGHPVPDVHTPPNPPLSVPDWVLHSLI